MIEKKPFIGITMDSRESGEYSSYPWYVLRKNYCEIVIREGGIPFPLTHDLSLAKTYLSLIDGLIITGGKHDIHPSLYGEEFVHSTVTLNLQRTAFELEMAKIALERNIPILGICGGEQVINVALGGSLVQHIPEAVPQALSHLQKEPCHHTTHDITIVHDTLLHRILKKDERSVNSLHHQAVRELGKGVVVNALAPDGVIEGIEAPSYRFCLGVQWHPEYGACLSDQEIFASFIKATRE